MTREELYKNYKGIIDGICEAEGKDIATGTEMFMHNVKHYVEKGFDVYKGMDNIGSIELEEATKAVDEIFKDK